MSSTRALLFALVGIVLADIATRWAAAPPAPVELPARPGFDRAAATTLRFGRVDEPVVLERGADGWRVVAPVEGPADPDEVDALLGGLADGVRPDAQVADGGDLAPFGLTGGSEVRVEVLGGDGVLLSVVLGADAGDGGTFVRWPDDPRVFRARVGGRSRYDRPPRTLLDRRVAVCDPTAVGAVSVPAGSAVRTPDGWVGLDASAAAELVASVCRLRGEVADPARVEAWDLGEVVLDAGTPAERRLRLGRGGELRYVGVGARVWRIPGPWVDRVADPATFADRALWTLARVDRIELRGPAGAGELARAGDGWELVRPAHVDIDPARAAAIAAFLQRPRVLRWERPADPGFAGVQVVVSGAGSRTLELGATVGDRTWVRTSDQPERVGAMDARVARSIVALFGG